MMTPQMVSVFADLATILGGCAAAISLPIIIWQGTRTAKLNKASFLLEVERMSEQFEPLAKKFYVNGEYHNVEISTELNWHELDQYFGFFEHCEILLQQKMLDERAFFTMFGYPLKLLAEHPTVKAQTINNPEESKYWTLFAMILQRAVIFDENRK